MDHYDCRRDGKPSRFRFVLFPNILDGAKCSSVLNLVMVFNMGTDIIDILESPIGQPFAAVSS